MASQAAESEAPAPTNAEEVRELLESQQAFSARGEAGERRGLFVRLGEVRGYAPASALDGPEEPDELAGRDLLFRVMAFAPDGKRALLTTRPDWPELRGIMERGETAAARIAGVLRGGLVVEVAGVPCFLPANRIVELRGGSVSEAFEERLGSEIDVRVIDLEVRQREAQYIASTDLNHDRAAAAEGMRALAEHRESGEPIEAEVIRANSGGLVISVGGAHAFVPRNACGDGEEDENLADRVGERIRVAVTGSNMHGRVIASERAVLQAEARAEEWDEVERLRDGGEVFEAEAVGSNKDGVLVDIDGVRGFLPWSQAADGGEAWRSRRADRVGLRLDLRVIEAQRYRGRAIVSELAAMDEDDSDRSVETLAADEVRTGRIERISATGIFMDVDGARGFVPRPETTWQLNADPAELHAVGDEVSVRVTEGARGSRPPTLSIRQAAPEPWLDAVAAMRVGQVVPATVTKLVSFGAFARIDEMVEGLIHLSEMLEREIERPEDAVAVGDVVPVRILEIDPDSFRVGLSMRQAVDEGEELGWEFDEDGVVTVVPEEFAPLPGAERQQPRIELIRRGDELDATVLEQRPTGLLVDLGGINGFVARDQLSWLPGVDPSDFAVGERVRAVVRGVNVSARDVALSIRAARAPAWHEGAAEFEVGQVVPAVVRKVRRDAAEVAISERVGAVVRLQELGDDDAGDAGEMVAVGELIPVKLLRIDSQRLSITASLSLAFDEAEQLGWEFDEDGYVVRVPDDAEPAAQRLRELGSGRPDSERGEIDRDAEAPGGPAVLESIAAARPQHGADDERDDDEDAPDRAEREDRDSAAGSLLDELKEGEIRSGRVTGFRNFGVFVDLGGESGLIHRSELSWDGRLEPADAVEIDETVEVYVTRVDKGARRIGLSLRRASREEWDEAAAAFSTGDIVPAEVTKLVNFGAFARIAPPVEGLIHRSELDDEELEHPSEVVEAGDLVPVKILDIDEEKFRVMLSLKQAFDAAEAAGWTLDEYGRVERLPDEVAERYGFEQGGDGPPARIPAVE